MAKEFKQTFDPPRIEEEITRRLQAIKDTDDPRLRSQLVAELQVSLSERAEIASQRVESQTDSLIRLTRKLNALTIVLALLTLPLAYDAVLKIRNHYQAHKSTAETDSPKPQTN